jgi:phosphatidylglycerol:prolipoprotein diacylglycerol transferase
VVGNANRLRRYRQALPPPAGQAGAEPQVETASSRAAEAGTAAVPATDPVCGMTVDPPPLPPAAVPARTACTSARPVALAVLVVLLGRVGVGAGGPLAVALAASLAGAAGARGWYVMLERGKVSGLPVRGLCIQGFLAGAVLAGIPGLLLARIPAGTFFDAAAPGVFLAMAIGRQGCFFTGCCAGRPSRSRWGIWSSDGRIGARRLPAQQLESLACLLLAIAALAAFLRFGSAAGGAVFAGSLAAYTLARQGLLALRTQARRWALAQPVTVAAAAAALLADVLLAALR